MIPIQPNIVLTHDEAAAWLGISLADLRELVLNDTIKTTRLAIRDFGIAKSELIEYADKRAGIKS